MYNIIANIIHSGLLMMIVGAGINEKRGEEDNNEVIFSIDKYPLFQP